MGTDLFVYHGVTEFYLDGRWVELYEASGGRPVQDFGTGDAVGDTS